MTTTLSIASLFEPLIGPSRDPLIAVDRMLDYVAETQARLTVRTIWLNREPTIVASSTVDLETPIPGLTSPTLRAIMARLAKLAHDQGSDFMAYGGLVDLEQNGNRFQVDFVNTSGDQWVTISPLANPSQNGHHA